VRAPRPIPLQSWREVLTYVPQSLPKIQENP